MRKAIVMFLSIWLSSCTNKMLQQTSFEDKCYESAKGPLFAGNRICFHSGGAFKYVGHGPSVFVSAGSWKYDKLKKEIELTSDVSQNTTSLKAAIDTMWLDLTGKRIKVKNGSQFLLDEIMYKLKMSNSVTKAETL